MNTATQPMQVVIHVDETLDEAERSGLADRLASNDGIYGAEFCSNRYHLMLVQYNREELTSQQVLRHINSQAVHAELVGPV
jgi:hypothetical protein